MGTEMKIIIERAAAYRAGGVGTRLGHPELRPAGWVKDSAAPLAFQKDIAPFYGDEGDEEKAQVMIQPSQPGRRKAAARTGTFRTSQFNFLRLHAADKDEDTPPLSGVI